MGVLLGEVKRGIVPSPGEFPVHCAEHYRIRTGVADKTGKLLPSDLLSHPAPLVYAVASGPSVRERLSSKKWADLAIRGFYIHAGQSVLKCLARPGNLGYPRSREGR